MKKYTFNIDLIIAVIVLFVLCIATSVYQSYLHDELHKENMTLQESLMLTKLELIDAQKNIKNIKNIKNSNE